MRDKSPEILNRILEEAGELAANLNQSWLTELLLHEREALECPELRVVFIGPASSGKTSTILSLLGEAGEDGGGEPILPVAVYPTTAQIVEVHSVRISEAPDSTPMHARLTYLDNREREVRRAEQLRELIATADARLRRVVVEIGKKADLPAGTVLVDTPGVGSDDGEEADAMVAEALGMADLIFFFLRISRGLAPCSLRLLERVTSLYPYPEMLARRLVPVLTDARLPERIPEILDGLEERLGFSVRERALVIPEVRQVGEVRSFIHHYAGDPSLRPDSGERVRSAMEQVVIPELSRGMESLERLCANRVSGRRFLEEQVLKAEGAKRTIRQRVAQHRQEAEAELKHLALDQVRSFEQEFLELVGESTCLVSDELKEEFHRSLNHHHQEFFKIAHGRFIDRVSLLANEVADELEPFDQEFHRHDLQWTSDGSGLGRVGRSMGRKALDHGARKFLGHVHRLGGRGGTKLGTINLARKGTAKLYRAFGKKAPAELIRKGIPKAVGPLGSTLKFMAKNQALVYVVFETAAFLWNLARGKAKVREIARSALETWLNGPKPSLRQKIGQKTAPLGVLHELQRVVEAAWGEEGLKSARAGSCRQEELTEEGSGGEAVGSEATSDPSDQSEADDGIWGQVRSAVGYLDEYIHGLKAEVESLGSAIDVDGLRERLNRLVQAASGEEQPLSG